MKGRVIGLVGSLCFASLIVSTVNARGKPDGPGWLRAEAIVFKGDLAVSAILDDCCPNVGPFPEFTMTLGGNALWLPGISGTYDGHVFINHYRADPRAAREYVVKFWTDSLPPVAIRINGGVVEEDKRNKVTKVIFTNEDCVDMNTGDFIATVSFELERKPHLDQTPAVGTAQSWSPPVNIVVPVAEPVGTGDVLVIDPGQPTGFGLGRHGGDPAVFGVVSAKPGLESGVVQLVLSGLALCKVDAGYGSIRPGDLLETSPTPGHAKRADDPQPGAVLGKALEPLDVGTGLIKVLVVLR